MSELNAFLLGALVTSCAVAGLFFVCFWRKTHDRLFAIFAVAFALMGANWLSILFTHGDEARYSAVYILRLAAFLMILAGIVDKNRTRPDT